MKGNNFENSYLVMLLLITILIQSETIATHAVIVQSNNNGYDSCIERNTKTEKISCEAPLPDVRGLGNKSVKEKRMSDWIGSTRKYLEGFYKTKITQIVEDSSKIAFIFDRSSEYNDEEMIEKIEYYKYTDQINIADSSEIVTAQVVLPPNNEGGNTKITYLSYWPNGVIPVFQDSKSANNMAQAAYVSISLLLNFYSTPLSSVVLQIASHVLLPNLEYLPVKVDVKAAINYHRVIGSYYVSISNSWIGNVQIGRQTTWLYRTLYRPDYIGGSYKPYHFDNIPISPYQTGYDLDFKKPHYDDIMWILNKSYTLGVAGNGEIYYDA